MAPPKLSLRQKRMKSRLNEVEKNFINSTTDADFARNSKLLQSLRTKAKEMGLPTKTDKQLIESINTNRKDKLKRGKIAGYQEGVYNPKTKKVDYASAVDDPNRYDIVSFADDLSTIGLGLTGAGLAYKIAKNPKLILELPKNVQKGVRAAYNKLKGNKTMAPPKSPKKAAVNLTLSAVSKALGSKLSKDSYTYLKGLPKIQRDALLPKVNSGSLSTLKKIKDAAGKLDNSKLISNVSKTQTKATKALNKSKTPAKPKTTAKPKTNTKPKTNPKDITDLSTTAKIVGGGGLATAIGSAILANRDKKEPKKVKENPNRAGTVDEFGGGKTPPKPKANPRNKSDSETVSDTQKKETQLGTKKAKGESEDVKRRRKSQLNKTKSTLKPLEQGIRKYKTKFGEFTVDSTDEGMRNPEDDLNLYKGGMAFGKGGIYKGAKKTYGMRNGGFTRRGMGK